MGIWKKSAKRGGTFILHSLALKGVYVYVYVYVNVVCYMLYVYVNVVFWTVFSKHQKKLCSLDKKGLEIHRKIFFLYILSFASLLFLSKNGKDLSWKFSVDVRC